MTNSTDALPSTSALIAQATRTKSDAIAQGRHDLAAEAQAIIDNLEEKQAAADHADLRLAAAQEELRLAKQALADAQGSAD